MLRLSFYLFLPLLLLLVACRGEEEILVPIDTDVVAPARPQAQTGAMVLVCEGNMGSNKASIDYMDFRTGRYHRNIYATLNPQVVMALGDVGNDVLLHGSRLYVVVNASGLVEVMHATTGQHLGKIDLPNCRYLAARGGKVYATSFAAPIGFSPTQQPGEVVEIDTLTLRIERRCTVGEQPEGLALSGDHLLVANSGGYRAPHYSNTVSVLRLKQFQVERTLEVGLNPHHLLAAPDGQIYVSTRGNYKDVAPAVQRIDPRDWSVSGTLGFVATSWWMDEGKIYALGAHYREATQSYERNLTIYDTRSQQIVARTEKNETRSTLAPPPSPISWAQLSALRMPYGIAVNPETKDLYIADAGNFTSSGKLHAFSPTGQALWQATTGDIPGHFAFIPAHLGTPNFTPQAPPPTTGSRYVSRVLQYRPAPSQHVNALPEGTAQDSEQTMCEKVLASIGHNRRGLVSLGAWGGHLVVGFDHRIVNRPNRPDFHIDGNAFEGSSEPGLVEVAIDRNQDGRAEGEEWYRLLAPSTTAPLRPYRLTYTRPADEATMDVPWRDAEGRSGSIVRNGWHSQPYYPLWLRETALTFSSWRLPDTAINRGTPEAQMWVLPRVEGAWADNGAQGDDFDLDWAVDAQGHRISLSGIDFVRITTALHQSAGWLGETSTEVSNVYELP